MPDNNGQVKLEKVPLNKYFDIESPKQDDKIRFNVISKNDKQAVPFLGRSAVNNGIVDYVAERENYVNKGNVLTIALDGSTGSTFYQYHDFSSGQNIWILRHKAEYLKELTPEIAMFFVTSIRLAVKNYTGHYNLSLTKKRLNNINILLPVNEDESIDADYINRRMQSIRNIEMIRNISDERYE